MKYFIVSDVHSFYDAFMRALTEAGFNKEDPDHTLVVLGDLLDRGPNAIKCLEYVNSLPRKILIRGNHEDLLEEALVREEFKSHDYHNGTADTVLQLCGGIDDLSDMYKIVRENKLLRTYLDSLVDYYETDKSIFVHGWIPCLCERDEYASSAAKRVNFTFDPDWREGDWSAARWYNGMQAWSNGVIVPDKTIYCGHFHTSWGHHYLHKDGEEWPNLRSTNPDHRVARFDPFVDDGIIAIDACTAYSHKVNCVVIEE